MLRTVSRSACRSARRTSHGEVTASSGGILNARASQSIQQWRSKTTQATTGRQSPLQALPMPPATQLLVARCMSSSVAANRVGSPWKTGRTSPGWEEEGRPVAPILSGKQKLPSNLKLAVEASSSQGEGQEEEVEEGDEFYAKDSDSAAESFEDSDFSSEQVPEGEQEQEGEEEEDDSLSPEDVDAIESLLDIPPFAGTEVQVTSWSDGSAVGVRSLEPSVFGVPVRRDVVHDVVRWQLARRRSGNGNTKRIGEISGSGRKVRPQKGGGTARAGHSRPPHWRGGAKAHGPRTRDFSFKLNKKFVKLGLRVALSARLREGQLRVVDELKSDTFSTSAVLKTLKARGLDGNVTLIVGDDPQPEFVRSARNIVGVKVLPARGANVYDIVKRPSLVLTEDAVVRLEKSLETK